MLTISYFLFAPDSVANAIILCIMVFATVNLVTGKLHKPICDHHFPVSVFEFISIYTVLLFTTTTNLHRNGVDLRRKMIDLKNQRMPRLHD